MERKGRVKAEAERGVSRPRAKAAPEEGLFLQPGRASISVLFEPPTVWRFVTAAGGRCWRPSGPSFLWVKAASPEDVHEAPGPVLGGDEHCRASGGPAGTWGRGTKRSRRPELGAKGTV